MSRPSSSPFPHVIHRLSSSAGPVFGLFQTRFRFVDASLHLCKRVCPRIRMSIRPSLCPCVRPSLCPFVSKSEKPLPKNNFSPENLCDYYVIIHFGRPSLLLFLTLFSTRRPNFTVLTLEARYSETPLYRTQGQ